MITTEVNSIALAQAAEAIVGQEKALEIVKLYKQLDQALFAGYELGVLKGQQDFQEATASAFDVGFEQGEEHGQDQGYGSGYVDGVRDARANPAVADDTVSQIIAEREYTEDQYDLFDEYEYTAPEYNHYDEDDYCGICGGSCEY
jgi:hypothetical protein